MHHLLAEIPPPPHSFKPPSVKSRRASNCSIVAIYKFGFSDQLMETNLWIEQDKHLKKLEGLSGPIDSSMLPTKGSANTFGVHRGLSWLFSHGMHSLPAEMEEARRTLQLFMWTLSSLWGRHVEVRRRCLTVFRIPATREDRALSNNKIYVQEGYQLRYVVKNAKT
ncbi:hypothetical protein Hypma_013994 [Hypsizygus marmoreus]|uniref:Uncharacterized protein n=1 Tax=Hypsizygus marmoreus TaxID=39966 RepID=A0A369K5K2_HYPMA|nr:hypothetical protein Hypma_013994 [Hypsizygus marmoreus]